MKDDLQYDTPLFNPDDDVLGRRKFSENLAKSIVGLNSSQGFVYGLYGPWGSGKSTIINFVEHYINNHNKQPSSEVKVVVFRFNPWMFSGCENLTNVFLDQLRARLRMSDVSKSLKKVSKTLELVEQGLSFTAPVGNLIIPGLGVVLQSIQEGIASTKDTANSVTKVLEKDLYHIKEDVTSILQKQKDKILVVIDDIDRLFDDEIRDFVKMIKAVCDFPKIIYLIACDRDKIATALNRNKEDNADGYDYLEKIVQCSFNLPRPSMQSVYNLFLINLDKILEPLKNKEFLFDETEWGNIFHDGVAPHLKTPRNIKVLINSIAACYPAVRDEVNVSDFVGIQVLRVFYAKAYDLIDHNKEFLAGSTDESYGYDYQNKLQNSFYDLLHSQVPKKDLETFKKLMCRLFPKYAQSVSNGSGYGKEWERHWKRNRRICSKECFDIYFNLSIPEDSFSLEEMQSIIALADTPKFLKAKLLSFIDTDKKEGKCKYKLFLRELENFTEDKIPKNKIKPLLQAIYDVSDEVWDDNYREFMDIGIDMNMLRISYQLATRFEIEEDRFSILREIFEKSKSVSMVVNEASIIDSKEKKKKDNLVTPEHAKELKAIALKYLKEFANSGKLPKVTRFASNIYRWRDWESEEEVKNYISNLIKTDEGLIDFLTGFLSISISHGMNDSVAKKEYNVPHKNVLDFMDIHTLEKCIDRARIIFEKNDQLKDREKKAIEAFIRVKDSPNSDWD